LDSHVRARVERGQEGREGEGKAKGDGAAGANSIGPLPSGIMLKAFQKCMAGSLPNFLSCGCTRANRGVSYRAFKARAQHKKASHVSVFVPLL
jgi:hypothetical protein